MKLFSKNKRLIGRVLDYLCIKGRYYLILDNGTKVPSGRVKQRNNFLILKN